MDPLLTFEKHIVETVKKANKIVGLLGRMISHKTKDILVPLYKSLVRPIIEYGNTVWSPYLRKHVDSIENVQRGFTRKVIGMGGLSYTDRLKTLNLPSLEFRRLRGDLIETFKVLHSFYDPCTTNNLFTLSTLSKTRGHNFKIEKPPVQLTQYQKFFTNRVIPAWNKLPPQIVNADSINSFKNKIDAYYGDLKYQTDLRVNYSN